MSLLEQLRELAGTSKPEVPAQVEPQKIAPTAEAAEIIALLPNRLKQAAEKKEKFLVIMPVPRNQVDYSSPGAIPACMSVEDLKPGIAAAIVAKWCAEQGLHCGLLPSNGDQPLSYGGYFSHYELVCSGWER